jgi:dTDP-4-dehydrorhamnose reductase
VSRRVAITGITGQVGSAFERPAPPGWEISGASSATVDVTSWIAIRDWIAAFRPQLVIHAAAMTDVDGCEADPGAAYRINALGTRHVAAAAERVGATFVYVSTNFVFDGEKPAPYHEFDDPAPINVYGHTKLAGERETLAAGGRAYIVRTAMVFDEQGRNFVNSMRRLMTERDVLRLVDDQHGNPTYAPDLAAGIADVLQGCPPGIYHLTNSGSASWFEWAAEIQRVCAFDCTLVPIPASEYKRAAQPPSNGVMESLALADVGIRLPDWKVALAQCLGRR